MVQFLKILLWLQTTYALWQFFRVASFLRLFYILGSSTWHRGGLRLFWPSVRPVYKMIEKEYFVPNPALIDSSKKIVNFDHTLGLNSTTYIFRGKSYTFIGSSGSDLHELLNDPDPIITNNVVELVPGLFIVKEAEVSDILTKVAYSRNSLKKINMFCIVDQSSGYQLNQNFMRILSISPLVAQARHLDLLSASISAFIIILDVFTFPANAIWQKFKWGFQTAVKLGLSICNEKFRVIVHTLLAGASKNFMYCDTSFKKTQIKYFDYIYLSGRQMVEKEKILDYTSVCQKKCYAEEGELDFTINNDRVKLIFEKAFKDEPNDIFVKIRWETRGMSGDIMGVGYETLCLWDNVLIFCQERGVSIISGHNGCSIHCRDLVEALSDNNIVFTVIKVEKNCLIADFNLEL